MGKNHRNKVRVEEKRATLISGNKRRKKSIHRNRMGKGTEKDGKCGIHSYEYRTCDGCFCGGGL